MRDLYVRQSFDGRKSTVRPRFAYLRMKGTAAVPCKRALPATVFGWEGEGHSSYFPTLLRETCCFTSAGVLASGQSEVDRYFRIYLDWFAVQ
jgi:hypothetical protein